MNGWKKWTAIIGAVATLVGIIASVAVFAEHESDQQSRITAIETDSANTKAVVEKMDAKMEAKLETIQINQNNQSKSLTAIQTILKIWAKREGLPYTGN